MRYLLRFVTMYDVLCHESLILHHGRTCQHQIKINLVHREGRYWLFISESSIVHWFNRALFLQGIKTFSYNMWSFKISPHSTLLLTIVISTYLIVNECLPNARYWVKLSFMCTISYSALFFFHLFSLLQKSYSSSPWLQVHRKSRLIFLKFCSHHVIQSFRKKFKLIHPSHSDPMCRNNRSYYLHLK